MTPWLKVSSTLQSREETAQSPQVLAPDERQIVKIARLDQNARPGEASAAAQSDARPGYSHERQPCESEQPIVQSSLWRDVNCFAFHMFKWWFEWSRHAITRKNSVSDVSQSEGSPRSPRHTGQPGVSPQVRFACISKKI